MDTITHGIVGALTGKALFAGRDVPAGSMKNGEGRAFSSPTARAAIVACCLGSMFPDTDIFAGPLAHNPLAIMEWHRSITHSALMLPLWALILAAVSIPLARWVKWESPPFWTLVLIYAVGIATHIFLDLVTSFGTMVWSPLRYTRPAWDWIFIIDLTLTGLALAPQLAAWVYRDPGKFWPRAVGVWILLAAGSFGTFLFASVEGYGFPIFAAVAATGALAAAIFLPALRGTGFRWARAGWCRAGIALVCAYVSLAAAAHHQALADVGRFAVSEGLPADNTAALPLPPTLTHWVALVNTPTGVWRATFHEPGGTIESKEFYADVPASHLVENAEKLRDVQVYLWFARFPVWRAEPLGDGETAIDISDVRFFREGDPIATAGSSGSKLLEGRPSRRRGFTFEIVFDAQGKVLSHGFKEPE